MEKIRFRIVHDVSETEPGAVRFFDLENTSNLAEEFRDGIVLMLDEPKPGGFVTIFTEGEPRWFDEGGFEFEPRTEDWTNIYVKVDVDVDDLENGNQIPLEKRGMVRP